MSHIPCFGEILVVKHCDCAIVGSSPPHPEDGMSYDVHVAHGQIVVYAGAIGKSPAECQQIHKIFYDGKIFYDNEHALLNDYEFFDAS